MKEIEDDFIEEERMNENNQLKKIIRYLIWKTKKTIRFLKKKIIFICSPFVFLGRNILMCITPVKSKKIIFLTFQGNYTCNSRAITEEIINQKLDWEIVWDIKPDTDLNEFPKRIKLVEHNTWDFYKELASAKIIVENTNIIERLHVIKKKNQFLFQTWHGSLGIKRLDGAAVMGKKWKLLAKSCQKKVEMLFSNSTFETEVFNTSYWKNVPVELTGHARNDIFFIDEEKKKEIKEKVYRALEITQNKKICLFAPTHRDNINESYEPINYEKIKEALEQRFRGEWQIVVRMHNRLKKDSRKWLEELPEYIRDATMYGDMQELLVATEIGITDYSSWIFDYVLSEKPGFVIKLGVEEFEEQRGFYYPLEETPFPICNNDDELVTNILNFNEEKYRERVADFLERRGCMEDGHASERIINIIKKYIE